jgi:hypothetical protein
MLISAVAGVSIDTQVRAGLSILWDFAIAVVRCRFFPSPDGPALGSRSLIRFRFTRTLPCVKILAVTQSGSFGSSLPLSAFFFLHSSSTLSYKFLSPCLCIAAAVSACSQLFNFPNRFFISTEPELFLRVTSSNPRR